MTRPATTALNDLFEHRLAAFNLLDFHAYLKRYDLIQEQVLSHIWTDGDGHRWSMLSRWGFGAFKCEANYPHSDMMHFLLDNMPPLVVGGETQPGQKDLIWAWMGSLMGAGSFSRSDMERLHLAFHAHLPTLGWGTPGDGGWLAEGLALLTDTVRKYKPEKAQLALTVFDLAQEFIAANLLVDNKYPYSRRLWEFDACSKMAEWMPVLQPVTHNRDPQSNMQRGPTELAQLPDRNPYRLTEATPRPVALAERFSEVFENLMRHGIELQKALKMEFMFSEVVVRPQYVERLSAALSDKTWRAWTSMHLDHMLRPISGADELGKKSFETLDFFLERPIETWASAQDQTALIAMLTDPGNQVAMQQAPKRLQAWAKSQRLQNALAPESDQKPGVPRKASRF